MTIAIKRFPEYSFRLSPPRLAAIAAMLTLTVSFGQGTGVVTGRIAGANGAVPIVNAQVYLHGKTRVFLGKTVSSVTGAYRFDAVVDGEYEVCATPTGADALNYVDSCLWDRTGRPVTIGASGRTATVDIQARQGAKVQVQVTDPLALLSGLPALGGGAGAPAVFHVGLWTREYLQIPMALKSSLAIARTFEALAPFDTEIPIGIGGTPLQIEVGGTRLNTNGGKIGSIRVDSTKETSKSIAVSIVGRAL